MNSEYIGVFDSGLGGLTAVKEIMKQMPDQPIIYFGDTGRVPYGTRGSDTIIKYVKGDIRFLKSLNVSSIVVACGTASSVALPAIEESDIPIIGVVDAAADKAVSVTKNKRIGVIGTSGTIKSGAYEKLIHEKDPSILTVSNACPLFVPLVENGYSNTEAARLIAEEYLTPIKMAGVDTLILGCTHYPLMKRVIGSFMGSEVKLIDPGAEVARYIKEAGMYCENTDIPIDKKYRFYVSDNIEGFEELGGIFLEQKIIGQVSKIDIEKY